jgi:SecD/SecF fusion protein
MRNRNTWIVLLAIFTVICLGNLYYTYYQFNYDGKVKMVAKDLDALEAKVNAENLKPIGQRDGKIVAAYDSVKGLYDSMLSSKAYKNAIDNSFTLGLDLQGGMFVTLEVGAEDIVRQLSHDSKDPAFLKAMDAALQAKKNSQSSFVDLFLAEIKKVNPNVNLGAIFADPTRGISVSTPEKDVVKLLTEEANAAIDRTYKIIRTRIDQFGVVSPNLQMQAGSGRILLELPGVKDPKRVRTLLKSTAHLEFWRTYPVTEAFPVLKSVNEKLKSLEGIVTDTVATDTTKKEVAKADSTKAPKADSGKIAAKNDTAKQDTAGMSDVEKAAKFKRENPLFAVLYPPQGNVDPKNPLVGYASASDTAKINNYLRLEEMKSLIPDDMKFLWTYKPVGEDNKHIHALIAIRSNENNEPALGGENVTSARMNFSEQNGKDPIVEMTMSLDGAQEWARITKENIGKCVAVVLDNMVYSYPTVQGEITGGRSQISGKFTIDEAKDLANVLKAGQLPVPARIQGEELVGPSLGASNISSGIMSFGISLLLTIAFMIFYYRRGGVIATIALIFNLLTLLGMSGAFGIVLTLPGVAGIVLTIGMAVDANVLIFERIREEMAEGKVLKAAIKEGFSNAFSSIMDSNITTFLTALVLYTFGVGPIKGFAVTLMIGIFTSLVSALLLTRMILEYEANRGKEVSFGSGFTINLFNGLDIKMSVRKRMFYMISGTLTVLSIISFIFVGFKTGVDFKGGRQYVVEFKDAKLVDSDLEKMRNDLTKTFNGDAPIVKTLSSNSQVQITTSYRLEEGNAGQEVADLTLKGLKESYKSTNPPVIISSSDVGPVVANDIKRSALFAVFFSLIIISLYILLRFRRWQYSLGAAASLFHDVIIVLGLFSIFSIIPMPFNVEIDSAFIAAILTIIGYSINDTVVVFDRIRENTAKRKATDVVTVFNDAINETLSRTLITSGTTILSAFVLLMFGGTVIKGFVFAIFMGIIFGTYSSIFIASAVAMDFFKRSEESEEVNV